MDDLNSKSVMKKWGYIIASALLATGAAGCSSAYFATAGYAGDDLYAVHDKEEIARRKEAEAAARKAEAEARRAEWEARLAEAEAAAAQNRYYSYRNEPVSNPYEEVLADTYQSAYARRLRGFESPTYNMPSSYYNFRYGSAFSYVSAYDPAFYNIMVMGDQVWVEPKYITAMFGTWGRPVLYADPWYYGWNSRSRWSFSIGGWGWGFGFGHSWYDSWYDPWFGPWYHPWWGPAWGPPRPGHLHWGGSPIYPHRRYAADIVHRADPGTSPSGQRYGGPGQRYGGASGGSASSSIRNGSNRGSSFGVRNSSGGSDRYNRGSGSPSRDNSGSSSYNRGSGSSYRDNSGSNTYNRGSSSGSGSSSRGGFSGGSGSSGARSSGGSYRNAGGR